MKRISLLLPATASMLVTAGAALAAPTKTDAAPPVNASFPSVTGTDRVGQTLTATTGSWGGQTPISFTYQWQRCDAAASHCNQIAGATTQTYVVGVNDFGQTIRLSVTATNADGSAQVLSNPTGVIADRGNAPASSKQPDPSGTAQDGQTITVDTGTWSGAQPISLGYQWQRCTPINPLCADIPGATAANYLIGPNDVGSPLRVVITATNAVGKTSATSNLTSIVLAKGSAPVAAEPPVIAGKISIGANLQGSTGVWAGVAADSFKYQWRSCDANGNGCLDIAGAVGSTYTVTQNDSGRSLRLTVTATNSAGSVTATSASLRVGVPAPAAGVIPVSEVSLPDRLVISAPKLARTAGAGSPVTVRFEITDTAGRAVSGALVYLVGLPYSWAHAVPERATDTNGWATLTITPTKATPKSAVIVLFVRARKPGDSTLAGVSNRRLVELRISG